MKSIFSGNSDILFRNYFKHKKFSLNSQVKEAGPSLCLSKNISFRLFGKDSLQSTV
jgi:hypothetical protein